MLFALVKTGVQAFSLVGAPPEAVEPPAPPKVVKSIVRPAVNRKDYDDLPVLEPPVPPPVLPPTPPVEKPVEKKVEKAEKKVEQSKPVRQAERKPHPDGVFCACDTDYPGQRCGCDNCGCTPMHLAQPKPKPKTEAKVAAQPSSQAEPHGRPVMGSWGRPAASEFKPYLVDDAPRRAPTMIETVQEMTCPAVYQAVEPMMVPTYSSGTGGCPGGICPSGGFSAPMPSMGVPSLGGSCAGGNCR